MHEHPVEMFSQTQILHSIQLEGLCRRVDGLEQDMHKIKREMEEEKQEREQSLGWGDDVKSCKNGSGVKNCGGVALDYTVRLAL